MPCLYSTVLDSMTANGQTPVLLVMIVFKINPTSMGSSVFRHDRAASVTGAGAKVFATNSAGLTCQRPWNLSPWTPVTILILMAELKKSASHAARCVK